MSLSLSTYMPTGMYSTIHSNVLTHTYFLIICRVCLLRKGRVCFNTPLLVLSHILSYTTTKYKNNLGTTNDNKTIVYRRFKPPIYRQSPYMAIFSFTSMFHFSEYCSSETCDKRKNQLIKTSK